MHLAIFTLEDNVYKLHLLSNFIYEEDIPSCQYGSTSYLKDYT